MSPAAQIAIVARREFRERARTRVFRITLIALSALVIGLIFGVSLLVGESEPTPLGVAGDSPKGIVSDIEGVAEAVGADVVVVEFGSSDAATAAVETGGVEAVLVDGDTIVSKSTPSGTAASILTGAAQVSARRQAVADLGLSADEVASVVSPVEVTIVPLEPPEPVEPGQEAKAVASFFTAVVLLTTIMMFGQFVAAGIVEEKQNRIVEVILSRIRTSSLLIGKVLGIGALGLVQVAALGIAAVVGLKLAPLPNVAGPDLASVGGVAVIWLLFWFILGYLTYSFMYATLGATISRQEDLQSVAFIPAIAIMPAYLLMVFSINGGANTWVRIASFVPLWSPIVMPFRINTGDAAPWEVVVSVGIIVVTIILLVQVGSRVYRGAALRTGGRVSLRDAWHSGAKPTETR